MHRLWDTSCPDWEKRLLSGRTLVPDLPLFPDERDRALRCFKRLRLPDVFGTPSLGNVGGPWFLPIVAALFGSYDAEAKRRMIQEVFILVPKKNSKSTSAAALMLTAAIVHPRPQAEFLIVAPTKEIAAIAFRQAAGMVRIDPELSKLFHIQQHVRIITNRLTGSYIQIKAADTDTITGTKSTGVLVDETHVFATHHDAADIFIEIRGALAARPDGFLVQITTQSKESPAGVFKSELKTARQVRDGEIEQPILPVLYELPVALSKLWRKKKYWPLVNPNLGRSVDETFLDRQLELKEAQGEGALALFASQHFNVEIGVGLNAGDWRGANYWAECADPKLTLDELKARSEVVVVGIDGGGLEDLLGLAVLGRERGTGRWLLWTHAWAFRSVLTYGQEIAPRLLDFVKDGDLSLMDRMGDDVRAIGDLVASLEDEGLLPTDKYAIGVDRVGIQAIVGELVKRGIAVERIGGVAQGWQLNDAIKTMERKLAEHAIVHPGQEMMNWVVGNARVEIKGNAVTITKQASGIGKIDPLMAALDAAVAMGHNPEPQRSVYDVLAVDQPQVSEEEAQADAVDMAILGNPAHPLWERERAKFEMRLPSNREEEDY